MEAYKKTPAALKSLTKLKYGAKGSEKIGSRDPMGNLWDSEGNYLGRIGFVGGKTILLQLPPLTAKEATQMLKTGDSSQAGKHYQSFLDYLKKLEGKRLDAEAAKEKRQAETKRAEAEKEKEKERTFAERKAKFDKEAEEFLAKLEAERVAKQTPEEKAAEARMKEEREMNLEEWKRQPLTLNYPLFIPVFDPPSLQKYKDFVGKFYQKIYQEEVSTGIWDGTGIAKTQRVWAFRVYDEWTNAYDWNTGKFLGTIHQVSPQRFRLRPGTSPDPMDEENLGYEGDPYRAF